MHNWAWLSCCLSWTAVWSRSKCWPGAAMGSPRIPSPTPFTPCRQCFGSAWIRVLGCRIRIRILNAVLDPRKSNVAQKGINFAFYELVASLEGAKGFSWSLEVRYGDPERDKIISSFWLIRSSHGNLKKFLFWKARLEIRILMDPYRYLFEFLVPDLGT
jgi:hypothetical protein